MKKQALVLSGGGSRGAYEIGVWQALREMEIPIHIVTGTSVGALNGAMIVQNDFELAVELWQELKTCMVFDIGPEKHSGFTFEVAGMDIHDALDYVREILIHGGAGTSGLERIVNQYVDEGKIRGSSLEFGLVTVELSALKPHYLFIEDIPKGKLHDYILASAACFPAVHAREIDQAHFIDGGYADVLPVDLAMEKGAQKLIAVNLEAAGFVRRDTVERAEELLSDMTVIKSRWDLGNFLVFDQDNIRRILRLGYLDTMKTFGQFHGDKYTFIKNIFTEHQRIGAEAAASIFRLDPCIIYTEKTLHQHLAHAVFKTESPKISDIRTPEDAFRKLNRETLVLYIADHLKEKEADSIFSFPAFFRLLKEETAAANYLLQNGILKF